MVPIVEYVARYSNSRGYGLKDAFESLSYFTDGSLLGFWGSTAIQGRTVE